MSKFPGKERAYERMFWYTLNESQWEQLWGMELDLPELQLYAIRAQQRGYPEKNIAYSPEEIETLRAFQAGAPADSWKLPWDW